jgi:hypothetical protein
MKEEEVREREGFVPYDSIRVITSSPIEDSNERVMKENDRVPSFNRATDGVLVSGPFNVSLDGFGLFSDFTSVSLNVNSIVVSPSPIKINSFNDEDRLKREYPNVTDLQGNSIIPQYISFPPSDSFPT